MLPVCSTSKSVFATILLPDLISHCTFDLHTNRNHKSVSVETKKWIFNGDPELNQATRRAFHGLKAGKFAAMVYSNAGYPQLRLCSDFLNWFFHLDNLSDDMDDRGIDNVANVIMNTIHHPHTYRSPARLNWMTKEFVSSPCYHWLLPFCPPTLVFICGLCKPLLPVPVDGCKRRWSSSSKRSNNRPSTVPKVLFLILSRTLLSAVIRAGANVPGPSLNMRTTSIYPMRSWNILSFVA